jgi:hypothetical protein
MSNFNISDKTNEILTQHGLDFEILKQSTGRIEGGFNIDANGIITLNEGSELKVSPYLNLVNGRTHEVLNSVKQGYEVSQNAEIVEKVVRGMEPFGDKLTVQKAGSLHGGRKVFLQLAIDGMAKVGGDSLKRFVTVIDSNDGSTSLSVGIGNLTMSCSNQFFKFYKAGSKFRHTASLKAQIAQLPTMIEEALAQDLRMIELFNNFQSSKCSRELSHTLVNELLGVSNRSSQKELSELSTRKSNAMDALYRNIETEMNGKGENLWGLFSGVTRWTTHEKSHPTRENGHLESLMIGTNRGTTDKALETVIKMMNKELVLV